MFYTFNNVSCKKFLLVNLVDVRVVFHWCRFLRDTWEGIVVLSLSRNWVERYISCSNVRDFRTLNDERGVLKWWPGLWTVSLLDRDQTIYFPVVSCLDKTKGVTDSQINTTFVEWLRKGGTDSGSSQRPFLPYTNSLRLSVNRTLGGIRNRERFGLKEIENFLKK